MIKKGKALYLLQVSLICVMLTGCSFFGASSSKSSGKTELKFNVFRNEEGIIKTANTTKLEIIYQNFSLAEGELNFKVLSPDNKIICEKKFLPGDPKSGKIVLTNLKPNEEYQYFLSGNNARHGTIKFSWNSKS